MRIIELTAKAGSLSSRKTAHEWRNMNSGVFFPNVQCIFFNCHCCRSETQREAYSYKSDIRTYSGGGYELKMKGQIAKLKHKLSVLQNNDWIDNRTRALITEFSVYNPQVILHRITNDLELKHVPGELVRDCQDCGRIHQRWHHAFLQVFSLSCQ